MYKLEKLLWYMAQMCKNLSVQVSLEIIFVIKLFALYLNPIQYWMGFLIHWKIIYYLIYPIKINLLNIIILTTGNCYHWNVLERNTIQHNNFNKYDFTKIFFLVCGVGVCFCLEHSNTLVKNFIIIISSWL